MSDENRVAQQLDCWAAWESRKEKGRDPRNPCQKRETRCLRGNREPSGFRSEPYPTGDGSASMLRTMLAKRCLVR